MAARAWIGRLQGAILSRPQRVALSGGTSARLLFDAVVQLAAGQPGLFDSVEFFWADERCVPPSDSESNYRLAWDRLLSPLGIQRQRIHRILGECAPEEAAVLASEELGDRVLDLAFLGMGEDGHVASLFPNASQASIECARPFLAVTDAPKPPPRRVSLRYAALASAGDVWVLAPGSAKADALRQSLRPGGATPLARLIRLRRGAVIFSDAALDPA